MVNILLAKYPAVIEIKEEKSVCVIVNQVTKSIQQKIEKEIK